MSRFAAGMMTMCLGLVFSQAHAGTIGSWDVSVEKDAFSPKRKTIAITGGPSGALGIRCFPGSGLSVVLALVSREHYEPGTSVSYKYRPDEGVIIEEAGVTFGSSMVELRNGRQIFDDAMKASVLNFRVATADGSVIDLAFHTRGASKALQQIVADCPDEPAADKKSSVGPASPKADDPK